MHPFVVLNNRSGLTRMATRINAEIMRKNFEKLFTHLKPPEPAAGLFDRIILAIKREQELRQTRKLLFGFLFLLIVSFVATPLSWKILASQAENSGIIYFLSAIMSDFGTFLAFWQDFSLAIAESLPIAGIAIFVLNMILAVFTIRLFLYKKRLLVGYLLHKS